MLGPTFEKELSAAGLHGLPFSWGADGVIVGRDDLTEEQNAALDAVIAAHDPEASPTAPVPDIISDRQFFQQLAILGLINEAEALAAVGPGTMPATLRTAYRGSLESRTAVPP